MSPGTYTHIHIRVRLAVQHLPYGPMGFILYPTRRIRFPRSIVRKSRRIKTLRTDSPHQKRTDHFQWPLILFSFKSFMYMYLLRVIQP